VAFNILLAGVPFLLLMASGLGFLLGESVDGVNEVLQGVLDRVLPARQGVETSILEPVFEDVVRTRTAFGIGGAIGFLMFSARLFASLRAVMKMVFSHGRDRSFLGGLLWDVHLSVTSAVLMTAWVALTTWLAISRGRVGAALTDLRALPEVLSGLEYWSGRILAAAVVAAIFVSLYRWLPKRRTPWIPALAGGVIATLLFELARLLFAAALSAFPPLSVFTGTLGALVIVVFWAYYAALIFVLGAETASATNAQLAPAEPS
jgi:membrane protein